jgi:hypothetical protein
MTISERSIQIAISQIGVQEVPIGSNGGPEVTQYLNSVGLGAGYPWCMAFVYWCVNKACTELNLPNPLVKTAGVLNQWNKTTLRKLPRTASNIKPGDIGIIAHSNGLAHAVMVESISGGLVRTVEGNSNTNGSREGYEVEPRQRSITEFIGFISLP